MPDDYHPPLPRRDPERIDLAAIKTDLEFLMERIAKFPTRQELALRPLLRDRRSAGSLSPGSSFSGGTASPPCGSFVASRWLPRYSPSFS
jgi:hypothetical protein